MLRIKSYIALCLIGLVCVACQTTDSAPISDRAQGFHITPQGDSLLLTVYSPWQKGQVLQHLEIQAKGEKRVVCTSATHVGFIGELGMTNQIVGLSRPERVYNLTEDDRARIIDIGDDFLINMEALLLCKPDLVIISSYMESDATAQQIQKLGIPVVYCQEWCESSPLARAEWIRFFGAIFGCQTKADSVFASVCDAYGQMRAIGDRQLARGKSIMSGMSWRGTWYMPAGGTFMGQLFKDAGADYHFANNPSTSSIPLNIEQVIQQFANADVWVGADVRTLAELKAMDAKHTWFSAYQTGQVYHYLKRTLPSGANDFWESGVVHPERILRDLQSILQGDTATLYYSAPLERK